MNDKYISVSKFKQSLAKLTVEGGDKEYVEAIVKTLSEVVPYLLDDSPAADVQPVKHGRWIGIYEYCEALDLRPTGLGVYYWCSECDKAEKKTSDFCPNCGARMDGDSE